MSRIAAEILNSHWFITKPYALSYSGLITNLFTSDASTAEDSEITDKLSFPSYIEEDGKQKSYFDKVEKGAVMVMPIRGAITKYNYCGAPGSHTRIQWIKEADANPNVKSIVLEIDSGGGSAAGTLDFAEAIKSCNTPIVAHVNGMAASAAYWIASACDSVYMANTMARVGSIGAYTTLVSFKKYYEKAGIDVQEIYATQSTDKNKFYRDFEEGNTKVAQEEIDELCQIFIDGVKENRPGVAESTLTGAMYNPADAMKLGLADEMAGIEEVINQQINHIMFGKKQKETRAAMISKLGLEESASDQDIMDAVEANAAAAAELDNVNTALGEHAKDYDSASEAVADLVSTHTENEAKITTLESRVNELGSKGAGGVARTVKKEKGDSQADNPGNVFKAGYGDTGFENEEFNLTPIEE